MIPINLDEFKAPPPLLKLPLGLVLDLFYG
jgi:hypothetical protein